MSKRRINKQQQIRIAKNQELYQSNPKIGEENLFDGLVITRFGKQVEIEDVEGIRLICTSRPNLDTLVAGDRIIWQKEGEQNGVVVSLYPRSSVLDKFSQAGLRKPVAANITQIIIVIAPKPEVSWPLLDSYLVMAEILGLKPIILFNKTDLLSETLKQEFLSNYQSLNYTQTMINKEQTHTLKDLLNHEVSVFVGQSGVGKSTIISQLLPHEKDIATQEISIDSELGKHTTSNSRYYHLPSGGALIDSPGVREFSLWNVDLNSLTQAYIEFRPFLSSCKFRNCLHVNTPDCAIISAVQEGLISNLRYENYIKLRTQYSAK